MSQEGDLRAVNWEFNAWGGTYDGLYSSWEEDNLLAKRVCERLGISYYDASPFVRSMFSGMYGTAALIAIGDSDLRAKS